MSTEPFPASGRGRWVGSREVLWGVVLLAVVLRVAHVLSLRSTIWFENLDLDPAYFDHWAKGIAAGNWIGDEVFFVDPLYPYFLAVIYATLGHDLLVVRLVQVAVDVGTVLLVAQIGRQVASRSVGNAAAFLYAVYAPAVFSVAEIEKTSLSTFLSTLAVVLVLRRGGWSAAFGGGALALAVLSRGNALVFALPLLVFLARAGGRWRWREPAAFLAVLTALLGLVVLRNQNVGGSPVLVSSLGQNLYLGNNPTNTSGAYSPLPFVRPNAEFEEQDFREYAEADLGRSLTPKEVSGYWMDEAFNYLAHHPRRATEMLGRKVALLLNDYEVPDNQSIYVVAPHSAVLSLPLLSFGWLLPLALLGLAVGRRAPPVRLLGALLVVYAVAVAVFFVLARFRLPAVPLMVVLAGIGLAWLVEQLDARHGRTLLVVGCVGVAVALISLRPLPFYDRAAARGAALYNLSVLQARTGDTAAATESLRESLRIVPGNEYALVALGLIQVHQDDLPGARSTFQTLTKIRPDWPDYWVQLGKICHRLGQSSQAETAFEQALALDPGNGYVRVQLAGLRGLGRPGWTSD